MAKIIRNTEHVSVEQRGKNKGDITLVINDKIIQLNRRHPISVTASLTTPEDAAASLQNGTFVISDEGELLEYRDQSYKGFIHGDEFAEKYGSDKSLASRMNTEFDLPEFGMGGKFNLSTGFSWSAFSQNLKTQVNVMRQICENGMVARNKLFEQEVPLHNMFDHHLDIAARQLITVSQDKISKRLAAMGREHSTNNELNLVHSHVKRRLLDDQKNDRLIKLNAVMEEAVDVSDYYTKKAIENNITNALPSTTSRMDLWNIATELRSHTGSLVESTESSLDRIASGLLFPKNITGAIGTRPHHSTFGSPELAFFGA